MPVFRRNFGIQWSGTDLYGIKLPERSNTETDKTCFHNGLTKETRRNIGKYSLLAYIRVAYVVVYISEQSRTV